MVQSDELAIHRRLTLNSASNLGRQILSMVVAFYLTPFIVRTLGASHYGFWILLMSFIGYASILEMGVQPAVVKLVAQYRGTGDREKLDRLITAALVFFLAVGAFAALVIVTVVPSLVRRSVEGLETLPGGGLLFLAIAADAMVMYMNYLCTGILHGGQRYHLRNLIEVAGLALNATLILLFLADGGLLVLVACKLSKDVFVLISSCVAVARILPDIRLGRDHLRRESFRELMGFGGRVFISATTTRIATHSQPVIISTALSAAATSFYAIPVKLVDYARQATWSLSAGFMPMFSELSGRNELAMLRSIYLRYTRYIFILLVPIPVFLFVYGAEFIGLWIGPDYAERGGMVLNMLSAAVLIESFHPLVWRFFIGVGNLNFLVKVSAVVSVLVVLSSLLLVRPFGITGVAGSVLIGAVAAQSIYALKACTYLQTSFFRVLVQVHLRVLLVGALVFGLARTLASTIGTDSYLKMMAGVVPCALVYAGLSIPIALSAGERQLMREKLGLAKPPREDPDATP